MIHRSYILATAGHVDHGKSALVEAISGINPDRLPEEKVRGITIDLGFAHTQIQTTAAEGEAACLRLGIVDVPGHEDFVKNMVAGVGSIDMALIIVAADDGWMPQTEEHVQILSYLGVGRAVIVVSKIDLAESEQTVMEHVRHKLTGTPFENAPLVATSVVNGCGIEQLKQQIAAVLHNAPPQRDIGKPRLPIDRVFTLRGIGTVVTGTLIGGSLRRGDCVVIQPNGSNARIRSIQTHNREVGEAAPGTRVALNLPDLSIVAAGDGASESSVRRGQVVTLPSLGKPTDTIDVLLERSNRSDGSDHAASALRDGKRVHLHHASATVAARLVLQNTLCLLPGQEAVAQLRLESPLFIFAGDRFILRDASQRHTLAGGRVLNPAGQRAGFRKPDRVAFLAKLSKAADDLAPGVLALVEHLHVCSRSSVLLQSHFSSIEVAAAIKNLEGRGLIRVTGNLIVFQPWWEQLVACAANAIDTAHQNHPERVGLPTVDLKRILARQLPPEVDVFEPLVEYLLQRGFVHHNSIIGRSNHRPALPPHLAIAGNRILQALHDRPLDPPSRKDLAPDAASFAALKFLLQAGQTVDISPELVLAAQHYHRAVEIVREHLRAHGNASVSELKQLLGTSRRVMVPLVEKLDRDGITRRVGDQRELKEAGSSSMQNLHARTPLTGVNARKD